MRCASGVTRLKKLVEDDRMRHLHASPSCFDSAPCWYLSFDSSVPVLRFRSEGEPGFIVLFRLFFAEKEKTLRGKPPY